MSDRAWWLRCPRNSGMFPYTAALGGDIRDSEPVSHVRDHSKFLAPHGLPDIFLSITTILRGWTVNACLLLSVLVPLAALLVLTNPTKAHLDNSVFYHIGSYLWSKTWFPRFLSDENAAWVGSIAQDPFIATKAMAIVLVVWLIGWATWRSYVESYDDKRAKNIFEPGSKGTLFGRKLIVTLIVMLFLELQPVVVRWAINFYDAAPPIGVVNLFGFSIASVVALATVFRERFAYWVQAALNSPTMGARIRGALAKAAFYVAGLAVPLLVYGLFIVIASAGIQVECGKYPILPSWLQTPDQLVRLGGRYALPALDAHSV